MDRRTTVYGCAVLEDEMKPASRSTSTGMRTDGVVFHHDNPRPHTVEATVETIRKTKWVSSQLPRMQSKSRHIWLLCFQTAQRCVTWTPFPNDEGVKDTVCTCLRAQIETFTADSNRKLVDRSTKCFEKLGDYVEIWEHVCCCVPTAE